MSERALMSDAEAGTVANYLIALRVMQGTTSNSKAIDANLLSEYSKVMKLYGDPSGMLSSQNQEKIKKTFDKAFKLWANTPSN